MSTNLTQSAAEAILGLKYCSGCEAWKASDKFSKGQGCCKTCVNTHRQRIYYHKNSEKILKYQRAYRAANRDKIRKSQQLYYITHKSDPRPKPDPETRKTKKRERQLAYYMANRDKILEERRAYRAAHKERILEYQRAYRAAHKIESPPRPKVDPEIRKAKKREYDREYRALHREKFKERNRLYWANNRERLSEKERERKRQYYLRKKSERPPKPAKPPKPEKPPLVLQPELQQAITIFLNVKKLKRPRTLEWYSDVLKYYAEHLIKTGLPQWPAEAEVIADNVISFLAAARERGCQDQTVFNYFRALCSWLNWLKRRKKIVGDVIELIEKPPQPHSLPKVVKENDTARLIAALTQATDKDWLNLRDRALIILALDTGARIGELVTLTWDNLNMELRTITATDTKAGKIRTIVFSANAAGPLAAWLNKRDDLDLPTDVMHIFVNRKLASLGESGIRYRLALWQKRAGIARFNFHRLRHTYAVYTLRAQGDLLDIQKQLGHASIATTAIYVRVDDAGRASRHNDHNPLAYLLGATTDISKPGSSSLLTTASS